MGKMLESARQMWKLMDDHPDASMHAFDVMEECGSDDMAVLMVAMAHDMIEDGIATRLQIQEIAGPDVAMCVDILTREKEYETYNEYIQRIKNSKHPIVRLVKIADLRANLKKSLSPPFYNESLAKRYTKALATLGVNV